MGNIASDYRLELRKRNHKMKEINHEKRKCGLCKQLLALVAMMALALQGLAVAQTGAGHPQDFPEPVKNYSPYVERTVADSNLAEGVYWGDTHLHTSYSTDAGMFGNTLGPAEAYRFARGEEVLTPHGLRTRLIRPLDFLVVADHAENLGLSPFIAESNPELPPSESPSSFAARIASIIRAAASASGHRTAVSSTIVLSIFSSVRSAESISPTELTQATISMLCRR